MIENSAPQSGVHTPGPTSSGRPAPKPGGARPGPKPGRPAVPGPRPGQSTLASASSSTPHVEAASAPPAADATTTAPDHGAAAHHPVPHPPNHAVAVHPRRLRDPREFGRIDDDGTVWLVTSSGERQVGSWQAGDATEGMAHFVRRFEDLAAEVDQLEARLHLGTVDAKKTRSSAEALAASLSTASVVGDVETLAERLQAIAQSAEVVEQHARQHRDEQRAVQAARKEALCVEAEEIGTNTTQWKTAGDRLREILDEWKSIKGIDRKTDDVLWKRFSKAREAFNRRRGAHFAELDRERAGARARKEELVAKAESLASSTDWATTATLFRDLMSEWKVAGRAPRDTDDALWKRFKTAQDVFFEARNAELSAREAEFVDNAHAKEALLREAEAIDPAKDLESAKTALRTLQAKWEEIGKVPRDRVQDLEAKLRVVENRVRDASEAQWKRTDTEAEARAAQFRDRVRQYEEQAAKAEAAGKARDAAKARALAAQWEEWAVAAEGAASDH